MTLQQAKQDALEYTCREFRDAWIIDAPHEPDGFSWTHVKPPVENVIIERISYTHARGRSLVYQYLIKQAGVPLADAIKICNVIHWEAAVSAYDNGIRDIGEIKSEATLEKFQRIGHEYKKSIVEMAELIND